LPELLGVLSALFVALFFNYPSRSFPIENLVITVLFIVFTCGILIAQGLKGSRIRAMRIEPCLLMLAVLSIYGFVRWWRLRIGMHGEELVITFLMAVVGMVMGAGISGAPANFSGRSWRAFRKTLTWVLIAFSLYGLYQYFFAYDESRRAFEADSSRNLSPLMAQSILHALRELRIGGRLGNGNLFAALLATLAGLSLAGFRRNESNVARAVAAAAYLLAGTTILLTRSRGGLLTFLLATVLGGALIWRSYGWNSPKFRKAPAVIAGWFMILFLSGCGALNALRDRLTNVDTIRERLFYWQVALKVWSRNFIFGSGPGAFELYYPSLKPALAHESRFAHSWFFHWGCELGFVGLALFISVVLIAAHSSHRAWTVSAREETTNLLSEEKLWLALGGFLLLANGLFEYTFQTREFVLLFSIFAGAVCGRSRPEHESPGRLSVAGRVSAALLLVSCLLPLTILTTKQHFATFWDWEAQSAAESRDHASAAQDYAKALAWEPRNEGYMMNRAMALMSDTASANPNPDVVAGELNEADHLLTNAEAVNPLSPAIRQAGARLAAYRGDLAKAAQKWDQTIELYPNDAGYRIERAHFNLDRANKDKARDDIAYLLGQNLPVWEFQQPALEELRNKLGI